MTGSSMGYHGLGECLEVIAAGGVSARLAGDEPSVRGMAIDSRIVGEDNLFVCKGAGFKPCFLERAVAGGAAAYLCQGVGDGLVAPSELMAVAPGTLSSRSMM